MIDSKVAIVTGTSRGIGTEVARQLGELNIVVIVTAREEAKAQALAEQLQGEGLTVYGVKLDVTNAADIAAVVQYITDKFGRLDILVNNAGERDRMASPSVEKFRSVFEVNVIGPYALTQALLPLLKASPAGRIVNQSTVVGSFTTISKGQGGKFTTPAYTSSKAALNMLTVTYAYLLKGTKIKVNSAHPGWVKTEMGGPGAQLETAEGAKTAVWLATLPEDGPNGGFFNLDKSLPW